MFFRVLVYAAIVVFSATSAMSQAVTINHQGSLKFNGVPANGNYDFEFDVYTTATAGQFAGGFSVFDVPVVNGIYSANLSYPLVTLGTSPRFLQLYVRPSGTTTWTELTPRQSFTQAPYAVQSLNAVTLSGIAANGFIQNSAALQSSSNFNISGTGLIGDRLGVGTGSPTFKMELIDQSNTGLRVQTNAVGGTVASFGGNGAFRVDASGTPGGRFTVLENGNVGIGTNSPQYRLDVAGQMRLNSLGAGGTNALCRNILNEIASCSSSIRYKENINKFSGGSSVLRDLLPVTFNWKQGGTLDLGLVAEDVAAIEPLLVTRNEKGEVEGVKYDRIGVVLINAFKDQQVQIDTQRKELAELRALVSELKKQIDKVRSN